MESYRELLCNKGESSSQLQGTLMSPMCAKGNGDAFAGPNGNYKSDFTYAQLIAMGGQDEPMASDELSRYHRDKALEKTLITILSTL